MSNEIKLEPGKIVSLPIGWCISSEASWIQIALAEIASHSIRHDQVKQLSGPTKFGDGTLSKIGVELVSKEIFLAVWENAQPHRNSGEGEFYLQESNGVLFSARYFPSRKA